jgi:hypothetical protein
MCLPIVDYDIEQGRTDIPEYLVTCSKLYADEIVLHGRVEWNDKRSSVAALLNLGRLEFSRR